MRCDQISTPTRETSAFAHQIPVATESTKKGPVAASQVRGSLCR